LIIKALNDSSTTKNTQDILRKEFIDVSSLLQNNSVRPEGLIVAIFNLFKNYVVYGEQIDIDELWMLFVDRLETELNQLTDCPQANTNKKTKDGEYLKFLEIDTKVQQARHLYNKGKSSPWLQCIQGTHLSSIRCTCGYAQANIEVFTSINLEVPENSESPLSIVDLLNNYTSIEKVDHWKCDKCSKTKNASKQINIWDDPDVIIMTLKRFKMLPDGRRVKTKAPIEVDEQFAIEKEYKLVSIGQHHGSYDNGHYTAICKYPKNNHWILYDDLEVRDFGKALVYDKQNVYFLIYEAIRL
jgi:ubiquitin C-terminal hydrolase